MQRPIIGITGNLLKTTVPSIPFGSVIDRNLANDAYVRGVVLGGGIPIILPLLHDIEIETSSINEDIESRLFQMLGLCDGFLIPGGSDVCPEFYGEEPHERLGEVCRERDIFDFHVARYALSHQKPLLGICRGEQLLNVILGGSLYQDLTEYPDVTLNHAQKRGRSVTTHDVIIEKGTRLYALLQEGLNGPEHDRIAVNSLHHQFVKTPGKGVIVTAHATDGAIEAFETADELIMAVQWHPEELTESVPAMRNLFKDLTERALKGKN